MKELQTHFASAERDVLSNIRNISDKFRNQILLPWFDGLPLCVLVINCHRQIVFCNEAFQNLAQQQPSDELLGKRPGEALDCIHSDEMSGGCGCSSFCHVCGAVRSIIKSFEGVGNSQNCKMIRRVGGVEEPLDLQIFTKPIEFDGEIFTLFSAIDMTHELRLNYMERTFYHGLINTAGGISSIMTMLEYDPSDKTLIPLLQDCSNRILRDVMYHRDVTAAEQKGLEVNFEKFELQSYLDTLIKDECCIRNTQPGLIEFEATGGCVTTDKRILGHVVRNMFSNAIESITRKSAPIRVTCDVKANGSAAISVSNSGVMPNTIQKQLFKRYVSTKGANRGLGVYVMKMMAEKYLGGEITFVSEKGETTFQVSLPAV